MNRRWVKHVRTVVICLLLGVVLTVGVAWGCARWALTGRATTTTSHFSEDHRVMVAVVQGPGFAQYNMAHDRWSLVFIYEMNADPSVEPPWGREPSWVLARDEQLDFDTTASVGSGWPLLSLQSSVAHDSASEVAHRSIGIWLESAVHGEWVLPAIPMGMGFIVDSAFYASISWVSLFGPLALLRHLRRHRGMCPTCGYDLANLDACPECGDAASSGDGSSTCARQRPACCSASC